MTDMNSYHELRRTNRSGRKRQVAVLLLAALTMLLLAVGAASARAAEKPIPTLRFINPTDGATVTHPIEVLVFNPSGSNWYTVELGVDGGDWRQMRSLGHGLYAIDWNTANVAAGKHMLTANFHVGPPGGGGAPIMTVSINVFVDHELTDTGVSASGSASLAEGGPPDPCSLAPDSQQPCLPPGWSKSG